MTNLESMMQLLCGRFDNRQQYEAMQAAGKPFPYAEHVNTVCNDKIRNLPTDFAGAFLLEESYYTTDGKTHASPHLFLFTEEADGSVKLSSYEMPQGYTAETLTYDRLDAVDYASLVPSAKFTPAIYHRKDGVWEGGSVSMFTPVLKFTLWERFSEAELEVQETMEVNGKRTLGYDAPIRYQRKDCGEAGSF